MLYVINFYIAYFLVSIIIIYLILLLREVFSVTHKEISPPAGAGLSNILYDPPLQLGQHRMIDGTKKQDVGYK